MAIDEAAYLQREIEGHLPEDVVERIRTFSGDRYLQRIVEKLTWMGIPTDALRRDMTSEELMDYFNNHVKSPSENHYILFRFAWYRENAWLTHELVDDQVNQNWINSGELKKHHEEYLEDYVKGKEVLPENQSFVGELEHLIEVDKREEARLV